MKVCRFKKQHIEKLEISKEEKAGMLNYYDLYLNKDVSPAFTVKMAGMVQGVAGIRLISQYVGEAWVCFNYDFLHEHKKAIIVKLKNYIDFIGITFRLEKIQAVIDNKSDRDKRWMQFLGLRYEKKLESGFDIYSMKVKGV